MKMNELFTTWKTKNGTGRRLSYTGVKCAKAFAGYNINKWKNVNLDVLPFVGHPLMMMAEGRALDRNFDWVFVKDKRLKDMNGLEPTKSVVAADATHRMNIGVDLNTTHTHASGTRELPF